MNAPERDKSNASPMTWPMILAFVRLPLVLVGYGLAVTFFRPNGAQVGAIAGIIWSTVTVSVVNVISFGLLLWRFRVENLSIRDTIGFRKDRLFGDIGWGLLWSFLLFGLLTLGFSLAMLCVGGTKSFTDPDTFFWGGQPDFDFPIPSWIMFVSAFLFPLLNPPIEELHYRGYAQPRLIAKTGSVRIWDSYHRCRVWASAHGLCRDSALRDLLCRCVLSLGTGCRNDCAPPATALPHNRRPFHSQSVLLVLLLSCSDFQVDGVEAKNGQGSRHMLVKYNNCAESLRPVKPPTLVKR